MAVRLKVRKNRQIVAPIRFARAVSGDSVADAPDVDDRGFDMGTRPGTWGSTDTRGAMVSIQEGDSVRVRVLREDIDAGAPLFVNSTNTSVATIVGPAGPLGIDGIFTLQGVKDLKNVPVKIQVRLGGADGPLLGELEPHVFQQRLLRVRAHLVTINGVATKHTAADLVDFFVQVNVFWRPAGIEFQYNEAETRQGSIRGFKTDGQVTTDLKKAEFAEFSKVLNLVDKATGDKPDPNAINIYFVRFANEVIGLTFDHDEPRPQGFGVMLADQFTGKTDPGLIITGEPSSLAHELGHYLDSDLHAGEFQDGKVNDDIFSERRLMFAAANLTPRADYRKNVGYGAGVPGRLLSVKNLSVDRTDGEIGRNRLRALGPN
jgi:hypothetical protein